MLKVWFATHPSNDGLISIQGGHSNDQRRLVVEEKELRPLIDDLESAYKKMLEKRLTEEPAKEPPRLVRPSMLEDEYQDEVEIDPWAGYGHGI